MIDVPFSYHIATKKETRHCENCGACRTNRMNRVNGDTVCVAATTLKNVKKIITPLNPHGTCGCFIQR